MKTECVKVKGTIIKILPNAFFRVKLDGRDTEILAYLGGKISKKYTKLDLHDSVVVEMSPTDLTKGRIIERSA